METNNQRRIDMLKSIDDKLLQSNRNSWTHRRNTLSCKYRECLHQLNTGAKEFCLAMFLIGFMLSPCITCCASYVCGYSNTSFYAWIITLVAVNIFIALISIIYYKQSVMRLEAKSSSIRKELDLLNNRLRKQY